MKGNTAAAERHYTPQEERAIREAALDETIEDTFPASDPLSTIPNPHDEDALKRARAGTATVDRESQTRQPNH